jgi:hypothetical protein
MLDGLMDELRDLLGAEAGALAPGSGELAIPEDEDIDFESGEGLEIPEDDIKTWDDVFTALQASWYGAPIGQAIDALEFSVPGGSCETWDASIPFFGESVAVSVDAHCEIWPQLEPIISTISVLAYSFIAVRAFIR